MWLAERKFHVYAFEVLTTHSVEPRAVDSLACFGEFVCVDEPDARRRWGFLTREARSSFVTLYREAVLFGGQHHYDVAIRRRNGYQYNRIRRKV